MPAKMKASVATVCLLLTVIAALLVAATASVYSDELAVQDSVDLNQLGRRSNLRLLKKTNDEGDDQVTTDVGDDDNAAGEVSTLW